MPTSGSIDTTTLTGSLGSSAVISGSITVPTSLGSGIYMNTLKPILDDELSATSENAVKNKVIYAALQEYAASKLSHKIIIGDKEFDGSETITIPVYNGQ